MASRTIATILNLQDNFSKTIQNVSRNTESFRKTMRQTTEQTSSLRRGIESSFSGIGTKIAGAVAGIGIAEFAKSSLELASDLNEVSNVVDTTFGDMSSQIYSFASTSAAQFGISQLQAEKYTGTLGAMLKSAGFTGDQLSTMSTTLAGLAGDMASFYNLNPDEAFDKLRSGISGETEPLKALGVDISDTTVGTYAMANGFNKAWKDATQSEKELWRYKAILNQTKDSQGDYNKTADSFANQARTLKLNLQSLGSNIMAYTIPAFQGLFQNVNNFITGIDVKSFMDGLSNAIANVKPSFDSFVQGVKDLATTIYNSLVPAFDAIKPDSWDSVSDAIKSILDSSTAVVNFYTSNWSTIEPIIVAITAAFVAWKIEIIAVNTWANIVKITTAAWSTIELIIWGIKNATTAWEAAQWALNVAMDANLVGVVIMAIAALGYAIYEVITHLQDIYNWIQWVWGMLENNPILLFISAVLNPFGTALIAIVANWDKITAAIQRAYDWFKSWTDTWNNTTLADKNVNITQNAQNADTVDANTPVFNPWGYATGTQYSSGGWTMVGEDGPELMNMKSGGQVIPTDKTNKILNGNNDKSPIYVIIQGNVIGNEEYADSIGQHIVNKLYGQMVNS